MGHATIVTYCCQIGPVGPPLAHRRVGLTIAVHTAGSYLRGGEGVVKGTHIASPIWKQDGDSDKKEEIE